MKVSEIRTSVLCMMVGIAAIAGCGGGAPCADGSTDGTGGGNVCTWDGTGGGTQIPECSDRPDTGHFVGTLAGKPFDKSYKSAYVTDLLDDRPGGRAVIVLDLFDGPDFGEMVADLPGPRVVGAWFDVRGTFVLPREPTRSMLPGTKLRHQCNTHRYQFIIVFEDGQLTGCSGP